jgi:hypothetical protein
MFVTLGWKKLAKDKHFSLLRRFVNYGQKSFITLGPVPLLHFQTVSFLGPVK